MVEFIQTNMLFKQILFGCLLILGYLIIKRLGRRWIEALADNKRVSFKRTQFVVKAFNVIAITNIAITAINII